MWRKKYIKNCAKFCHIKYSTIYKYEGITFVSIYIYGMRDWELNLSLLNFILI